MQQGLDLDLGLGLGLHLRWPTSSPDVMQGFGANAGFYEGMGYPGHHGLDICVSPDGAVYAAAAGVVAEVDREGKDFYLGRCVRLCHRIDAGESGEYETVYANLSDIVVRKGDRLESGALLGYAAIPLAGDVSYIHFGLSMKGQGNAGFPDDIIDPTPYLGEAVPRALSIPEELPRDTVWVAKELVWLRKAPIEGGKGNYTRLLTVDARLGVLGHFETRRDDGEWNDWVFVLSPGGEKGWVRDCELTLVPPDPVADDIQGELEGVLPSRSSSGAASASSPRRGLANALSVCL